MSRVVFIGQALPKTDPGRPFGRTKLYTWFEHVGISDEVIAADFSFTAMADYFPGAEKGKGHAVPTKAEIAAEFPRLKTFLLDKNPKVLVAVGKLSIGYALGTEVGDLREVIGQQFLVDAYGVFGTKKLVIPLPHPSGASTWFYKTENKVLLNTALHLLQQAVL